MNGDIHAIYEQLCAPMPTATKQGLSYITGEQAIRRANETLSVQNWDFEVRRTWFDREADCVLCHGRLTIRWPDGTVSVHEDIGAQVPNRKRAAEGQQRGDIIELGNDYKGARTDALKRCLADVGVGLWLYHKVEPGDLRPNGQQSEPPAARIQAAPVAATPPPAPVAQPAHIEVLDEEPADPHIAAVHNAVHALRISAQKFLDSPAGKAPTAPGQLKAVITAFGRNLVLPPSDVEQFSRLIFGRPTAELRNGEAMALINWATNDAAKRNMASLILQVFSAVPA